MSIFTLVLGILLLVFFRDDSSRTAGIANVLEFFKSKFSADSLERLEILFVHNKFICYNSSGIPLKE